MLKRIHPELKEKTKGQISAELLATKFAVRTKLELSGRGLAFQYKHGNVNTYYATKNAYDSLCKKYEVVQSIYFD